MHTQHDTAQVILGRGADYVMTVKGNMPTLYRQLKKLPWARIPAVSCVMATGSLAISLLRLDGHTNIAAANRHHARNLKRTLKLFQTA